MLGGKNKINLFLFPNPEASIFPGHFTTSQDWPDKYGFPADQRAGLGRGGGLCVCGGGRGEAEGAESECGGGVRCGGRDLSPRWQPFLPPLAGLRGSMRIERHFPHSPGTASVSPGLTEDEGKRLYLPTYSWCRYLLAELASVDLARGGGRSHTHMEFSVCF